MLDQVVARQLFDSTGRQVDEQRTGPRVGDQNKGKIEVGFDADLTLVDLGPQADDPE